MKTPLTDGCRPRSDAPFSTSEDLLELSSPLQVRFSPSMNVSVVMLFGEPLFLLPGTTLRILASINYLGGGRWVFLWLTMGLALLGASVLWRLGSVFSEGSLRAFLSAVSRPGDVRDWGFLWESACRSFFSGFFGAYGLDDQSQILERVTPVRANETRGGGWTETKLYSCRGLERGSHAA